MAILVLVGASGTGKTTAGDGLCQKYLARYVLSLTTRLPRPDEIRRIFKEYEFNVSKGELDQLNEEAKLEWMRPYAGNWYATKKEDLQKACKTDELRVMIMIPEVLLELDKKIKEYGGQVEYVFFEPTSEQELERRISGRKMFIGEHQRRMTKIVHCKEKAEETKLPFTYVANEGTTDELIQEVVATTRRLFGDEVLRERQETRLRD